MPAWPSELQMPFVKFVFPGWALAFVGALMLLGAAIYWAQRSDGGRLDSKPGWWRTAVAVGSVAFVLGILWQLIGYVRIGAVTWPD